jgi:hypothetical protein
VWRTGPVTYSTRDGALIPDTRPIVDSVWQNGVTGGRLVWAIAPASARDTRLREITEARAHVDALTTVKDDTPWLQAVGAFDPDRLGGAQAAGAAPLTTLQPPLLTARDEAARRRLGAAVLRPNGNFGGYLASRRRC